MEQQGNQHVDLRVRKTREAIKKAFREMVREMDADDITVKELADRARIHRKTFYLHYTSIEALFEDALQDIADTYFDAIDTVSTPMRTEDVNRVFFEHMAEHDEFAERLLSAPSYRDFCGKLFKVALQHNRSRYNPYAHLSPEEQNIVNIFLVSSTLDMYRTWVSDGKKIPLEDMIELSGKLLSCGSSSVRKDADIR